MPHHRRTFELQYLRTLKMNANCFSVLSQSLILACCVLALPIGSHADTNVPLPTGQYITPLAPLGAVQQYLNPGLAAHPNFIAGEAVRAQLSPDGTTLAILCAGQNTLYDSSGNVDTANSTQYVFIYDVAGDHKRKPALMQVIRQRNAYVGLVWAPNGATLYAGGGNDDAIYAYTESGGAWALSAKIALGHSGTYENKGLGLNVQPNAAGLAISADGKTLVVANNYNDSITVIDTATKAIRYEHDLRPYFANNEGTSSVAGGTYPFAVAVKGNATIYVSANRDREVDVVDISSPIAGRLIKRIKLAGNPLGMALDAAQKTLYVAQDNADQVAVINTANNEIIDTIDTRAPQRLLDKDLNSGANHPRYTGASPIAVTISPDGRTLYAVNDGANSVAVIPLRGSRMNKVTALIPTAYAPKDISFSADGKWMYIINGKSQTGQNPGHLSGTVVRLTSSTYPNGTITTPAGTPIAPVTTPNYLLGGGCDAKCQADNAAAAGAARTSNQYQFQLERASLVSAPVPSQLELERLTRQVAENNFYGKRDQNQDTMVMRFLHDKIKHVIYVVKENRTFDQILGDLNNGSNGDSSLTMFGKAITPNHHNLAKNFVTLDNFMDPGDGSMDGWSWSMAGRVTSTEAITQQINYAGVNRGLSYESEGTNRNVPVGLDTTAKRDAATKGGFSAGSSSLPGGAANLLVGTANHAVTDAPFGTQKGYIFDAVLQADLTVRNYGFLVSNIGEPSSDPFAADVVQVAALNPSLVGLTDLYFRGYDQNYPDLWRYNEWKREFDQYIANGNLPSLTLFRVSHDHMGNFGTALAGVNTPETQQADDDLAVGKLVDALAHSRYALDTLIFIIEDDCQDGPDHVDSHRAPAYVIGPYVKRNALVSTRYSQVNLLRTIEDILGTQHINLNTAYQKPMADVFDITSSPEWTYTAIASSVLSTTNLDLAGVKVADGPVVRPKHDAAYWAKATKSFDFSDADRVPPALFNKVLWQGLMKGKRYPTVHTAFPVATKGEDDTDR
jgi:DNA-binding beta-propeller fold protein YncE